MDGKEEFPLLVETWADLCGGISDEDFAAACRIHLARSKFFPCPAEIINTVEDCRPVRPAMALPDPPERKTEGIGYIYRDAFRGDMDARSFVEQLHRESERYAQ